MEKSFLVIAAIALIGLVACEEAPTGGSTTATPTPRAAASSTLTTTTATTTSAAEPQKEVWPPVSETPVTISPNLLQTNIMVVYDGSGSMSYNACGANGNRHDAAVPAVKQFVDAVPNDMALGLFVFDDRGASVRFPLTTNNKKGFNNALDAVDLGSGTPLKTAITKAYYELEAKAQSQLGYGRYILLVVTDGVANAGEDPTRVVNYIVDKTPVEVHTVGLCLDASHVLNQPGRTFYTGAQNPQQLVDGLKAALAEATEDDVSFE